MLSKQGAEVGREVKSLRRCGAEHILISWSWLVGVVIPSEMLWIWISVWKKMGVTVVCYLNLGTGKSEAMCLVKHSFVSGPPGFLWIVSPGFSELWGCLNFQLCSPTTGVHCPVWSVLPLCLMKSATLAAQPWAQRKQRNLQGFLTKHNMEAWPWDSISRLLKWGKSLKIQVFILRSGGILALHHHWQEKWVRVSMNWCCMPFSKQRGVMWKVLGHFVGELWTSDNLMLRWSLVRKLPYCRADCFTQEKPGVTEEQREETWRGRKPPHPPTPRQFLREVVAWDGAVSPLPHVLDNLVCRDPCFV